MWKTIFKRFLVMIPQLFVLSILIFLLAQFMPGDPFTGLITPETDPAVIERSLASSICSLVRKCFPRRLWKKLYV